jgi:hypothetical protein
VDWDWFGVRQGSFGLMYAAQCCLSLLSAALATIESRSGLSVTASTGVQLRVLPAIVRDCLRAALRTVRDTPREVHDRRQHHVAQESRSGCFHDDARRCTTS